MQAFGSIPRNPGASRTRPLYDPEPGADDNSKLVLVVDDSNMICRIVKFSLQKYGISTMLFHSGVDALNALNEGAAPIPDLVLLDINLPHMNGYDVATLLSHKQEFRSVPIVMLSGHDGIIDRFRAKRAGADEFISKPFDEPELVNKIFPLLALDIPEDMAGHKA